MYKHTYIYIPRTADTRREKTQYQVVLSPTRALKATIHHQNTFSEGSEGGGAGEERISSFLRFS